MALNLVYRNTDSQNRVEDLGKTLAPGAPTTSKGRLPVVAVTGSGDYTTSEVIPGVGTVSGIPAGGVGLRGQEVSLAFDGTWEFAVTGATAATAQGVRVYLTAAGALTTTAASNTEYGCVDWSTDYDRTRGLTPVRIGA